MIILNWQLGEWYFAVRCKSCDCQLAFLRDGEMDETIYLTDSCKIVLTCPDCHLPLAYGGDQTKTTTAAR